MASLNITAVRRCFPALDQPQVFLDNAGGSQTLGTVIGSYVALVILASYIFLTYRRISAYLSKTNVQLGASYDVGLKSTSLYSAGYEAAAKYINASPEEIGLFVPSNPQVLS
jgi:selenocysteine lyase/cysteine desulfurase